MTTPNEAIVNIDKGLARLVELMQCRSRTPEQMNMLRDEIDKILEMRLVPMKLRDDETKGVSDAEDH